MTKASTTPHAAFRVATSPAVAAAQLRVTLAVAFTLVVGIALGAASVTPRSGWNEAAGAPLTHDARLVPSGPTRS